jgi:putative ABC transport system permease protein
MRTHLSHLLRQLHRSPASAAAAVLTLALTLGAGTTTFAIVNAVLLTPPPFPHPDALVMLGETPVPTPGPPRMISYPTFEAWRGRAQSLATLAAFDPTNLTLTGLGSAERVSVTDIDSEFMNLLGVAPHLGRAFTPTDAGQAVVLVSHAFWQGRLGGDLAAVGRTIVLNGRAHAVVGVLPERFRFPLNPSDLWRPLPLTAAQAARTGFRMRALARLSAGGTPASLERALDEISGRAVPPSRALAVPLATAIARGSTRTLGLLAASAALAVLLAFANLAGLLTVRSLDRAQELSVRAALGAPRSAIAAYVMLEAQALVVLGATGGTLLAAWLTPAAGRLVVQQFGSIANRDIVVDWRIVSATLALAIVCAAVCGLVPAVLTARRAGAEIFRRGVTHRPRELMLRRFLIGVEVALAFVLLASMVLIGRSLAALIDSDPGFRPDAVITMRVSLPAARYRGNAEEAAFYASLQGRLTERLGAATSSIVDELPLTGDGGRSLAGVDRTRTDAEPVVRTIGDTYFQVMGIGVVAGRSLDSRDNASAPPRAVVSRRLAERLFGASPAVGRQMWLAGPARMVDIVGVVDDVKHRALDEDPIDSAYLSTWQEPSRSSHIVVRADRPAEDVIAIVRDEVARLDPELPVYAPRSMDDVIAASPGMASRRILMGSFTSFAILALVLSAVGLFGVVAHDVASRRPELALRVALGATPARLVTATLRQGATIVASGVACGMLLFVWSGQLLASLAPVAARFDLASTVVSAGVLLAVGIGAALPAARRAARTDPLAALRSN